MINAASTPAVGVGAIAVACWLGGCCLVPAPEEREEQAVEATAPAPAVTADGPFVYAEARRSRAAPPERFAAPWPGDLATLRGEWPPSAPPRGQSVERLCAGDPAAMRAWTDAAQRASAGTSREALVASLESMIEFCDGAELCARGREAIAAGAVGVARDVALLAIASCGRPEDAALVDVDAAPAAARLRWLSMCVAGHHGRPPATPERTAAARTLIELAVEGDWDSRARARRAAQTIGKLPGGTEAMRALAPSLRGHPRATLEEVLESEYFGRVDTDDAVPDLTALAPAERERAAAEREACARRGSHEGRRCLRELASIDYARAVALARELGQEDDAMRDLVALLVRFPEEGALRGRLRALGLVGDDCDAQDLSASSAMTACGRATQFDPEVGMLPVQHDSLAAELARLAPGALDDVVFEEIPPRDLYDGVGADVVVQNGRAEWADAREGAYALRAYSRGERFEVSAQMLDDWYDLEAVIGLLNTVARARSHDARWLVIQPTGGNNATVAAGPEQGLRTAIEERLLEPVSTRASANARDAEHELIRRLIESGELR